MSKVSLFKNVRNVDKGKDCELSDVIDWIKEGAWAKEINQLRETRDGNIKRNLMCFTPSGLFRERNIKGLRKHSGKLLIDIDKLEDPELMKAEIGCDKYTEYCFLSCSGTGLAVIVKIDPDQHLESFKALEKYYLDRYGVIIDKACKDVSRLRYVSYDPDIVWNPDSIKFVPTNINPDKIYNTVKQKIINAVDGSRHETLLKSSILIGGYISGGLIDEIEGFQVLESAWTSRDFDKSYPYKKTIQDGIDHGKKSPLTIQHFYTEEKVTKEMSRASKEVFIMAMNNLEDGKPLDSIDFGTIGRSLQVEDAKVKEIFTRIYSEKAYKFNYNSFQEIRKIEIFLFENWEFRKNVITQRIEYRSTSEQDSEFDSVNVDEIYRQMQHSFFKSKFSLDKLKSLLRSAFVEDFDPFKEYFETLPAWDGKDHISNLASYIKTTDQEFFVSMFKKMLVRSLACSLDCIENRYVFVFVGKTQFTGKSTFIRFLNPFGTKYYTEAVLQNSKDTEFSFAENFIYNLEELASVSGQNINRLKAIISKSMIKERKPYATHAEEVPRRCNFWGSTNEDEFLTDSQNTRWLCFYVNEIDWNYKDQIDIKKVWAQAHALYKSNDFDMQLTREEQKHRDIKNKSYEVSDYAKELIIDAMKPATDDKDGQFMTLAEVLKSIEDRYGSALKINSRTLGKYMNQLNFIPDRKRTNGNVQRGYYVKISVNATRKDIEEREKPF